MTTDSDMPDDVDDDFYDDDDFWCADCQGAGFTDCYCGGDLCVCENQGEIECHCQ